MIKLIYRKSFALPDEASYLEDARDEGFRLGREEGRAELLKKLRALGADEELLKKAAMQ